MSLALSERVVDVLEVEGTFGIAEHCNGTVLCNIKREAVACNAMELFHAFSSLVVEALGTDLLVTAACKY